MYIDLSDDANGRICLNAAAADKLKEAVDVKVNLASNSTVSFDGSTDLTPGVTGILKIANGGTNSNTNNGAYTNLINQGSLTNANTNLNRGLYTWSTSALNTPKENSYGGLYNFIANTSRTAGASIGSSVSNSWVWQVAFDTSDTTPYIRKSINAGEFSSWVKLASISDIDSRMGTYLPLSAGESKKLTGALGLTKDVMYGTTLPTSGFDGQLFFLEDDGATLPTGGNTGYALVKNSNADGDASWKSSQITWVAGTSNGPKPKIFNIEGTAIPAASASASGVVTTGAQTFAGEKTFHSGLKLTNATQLRAYSNSMTQATPSSTTYYEPFNWFDANNKRIGAIGTTSYADGIIATHIQVQREIDGTNHYQQLYMMIGADGTKYCKATKLYGAVWNDYAECRESLDNEPGYVLIENGNDTLSKSTERLQAFAGVCSDTFGFNQGETERAKTPIAVAGRVLVYPYQNKNNYKPGDCVCTAPGGTVDIMTREEIIQYPDRIVGTVSCVPDYEEWGGNGDCSNVKDPVKINGRIWIKVK